MSRLRRLPRTELKPKQGSEDAISIYATDMISLQHALSAVVNDIRFLPRPMVMGQAQPGDISLLDEYGQAWHSPTAMMAACLGEYWNHLPLAEKIREWEELWRQTDYTTQVVKAHLDALILHDPPWIQMVPSLWRRAETDHKVYWRARNRRLFQSWLPRDDADALLTHWLPGLHGRPLTELQESVIFSAGPMVLAMASSGVPRNQ